MTTLLSVKDLERHYGGVTAVDKLSFDFEADEILGIVGPNGAGKTTVFDLIAGSTRVSRGEISLDGRRIERLPPYRRSDLGISRTFQTTQAFANLTVKVNVQAALLGGSRGIMSWFSRPDSGSNDRRALSELKKFGLDEYADRLPLELPQIDQQRLAIAMAVASNARLLLLDEPSSGLIEREVTELLSLVRRLRDEGHAVIIVDHKMKFMVQLCDRILVMSAGRQIALGTPVEVANDPLVREVYLGEQPL